MYTKSFVFDIDPHGTDPNFLALLRSLGVFVKFHFDGRRGAVVQLSEPETVSLEELTATEIDPSNRTEFDQAIERGRQTSIYKAHRFYHMGSDDYGRKAPDPPECNNPECMKRWQEATDAWRRSQSSKEFFDQSI